MEETEVTKDDKLLSNETLNNIQFNQKEYDDKLKFISIKIEEIEEMIKDIKKIELEKEKKEMKGMITKIMDTTGYIHSLVDNAYFIGKLVLPIWLYYKVTKVTK